MKINCINMHNTAVMHRSNGFKGTDVSDIIARGDKALNENKFDEALKAYQQAAEKNPEDEKINRKLAKAYKGLGDYKSAEKNFLVYVEKNPDDGDSLIELGEAQRLGGMYTKALKNFEKAAELDSSNDLAKRSILQTRNDILSLTDPARARSEKEAYAKENLKTALNMAVSYLGTDYMADMQDLIIDFGETAKMGGTSNIAQYENSKRKTTVSKEYKYAAPQVIAAYLVHESVHAKDKDAYTSVREEQDAYEIAAKFWIKNAGGVKDPEMDYASELYKKSAQSLRDRVAEIYKLRDPSINNTSPNHPPGTKAPAAGTLKSSASQPFKEYDVIA